MSPLTTAAAPPSATSVRRRAADVVVLGSSLQAYAAAYLLAKRGKRAVLVEHASPQLAQLAAGVRPDLVLHLPAATPHLVNEATEALALWRGVEAACGARDMLQLCGSMDIAPSSSGDASAALGAMQEAGRAAGLPFGVLAAEEVGSAFQRLRPPRGSAALYTRLGGMLHSQVAAAALLAMAQRAGAEVAAGRCLLGWRDAGSHFALRTAARAGAAAAADEEVVFEVEQLLLVPEAATQRQTLALFGMAVPGAALWHVPAARWAAQEECGALPVWQLLGTGSSRTVDDPAAVDSCWGLPAPAWGPGRTSLVAQSLTRGQAAEPPERHGDTDSIDRQQRPAGADATLVGDAFAAELARVALEDRPGSEEAVDGERRRQAEQARQEEVAEQRMAAAGGLAQRLISGLGGRLADTGSLLRCVVTPDGESAVGSHPGHQAGRIVAAFPAAGSGLGCLPGDQLAPLLARLAVDELLGQPAEAVDAAVVALGREALNAQAAALQIDSWDELRSHRF